MWLMICVGASFTAACGRVGFVETDAALDRPLSRCGWAPPSFVGIPEALALNTAGYDGDPTMSFDGLELYYSTIDAGQARVMRATRPTRAASFGLGSRLIDLDAYPGSMNGFFLLPDGLTAYLAWRIDAQYDLYRVERASLDAPFGAPIEMTELNTASHEFNPRVSPDGRTLVYVRWDGLTNQASADAYLAHRDAVGDPWSSIVRAPFSTSGADAAAGFIGDANTIVFDSQGDLFVVHGEAPRFDAATPLSLNTAAYDGLPFPSADGCELVFISDRAGGAGGFDIYHVRIAEPTN